MPKSLSWETLSEREQRIVKIGGLAAVPVLLFGIILPLDHSVSQARARIAHKQEDLAWMQGVAPTLAAAGPVRMPGSGESMIVIVDRSARESGLGAALAGSEPNGPGGLQVRLQKASFDAIVAWLSRLAQLNGIRVDGASIDDAGAPGLVNAAITLRSS